MFSRCTGACRRDAGRHHATSEDLAGRWVGALVPCPDFVCERAPRTRPTTPTTHPRVRARIVVPYANRHGKAGVIRNVCTLSTDRTEVRAPPLRLWDRYHPTRGRLCVMTACLTPTAGARVEASYRIPQDAASEFAIDIVQLQCSSSF